MVFCWEICCLVGFEQSVLSVSLYALILVLGFGVDGHKTVVQYFTPMYLLLCFYTLVPGFV